tara:strand:- start:19701 stop:20366 length:666 start_codon:yes stop_codon:yes gene_type:complete
MKKLNYNSSRYRFAEIVCEHFKVTSLENLHIERKDLLPQEKLNFENESKTRYHDHFYSRLRSGWDEITTAYETFIKNEIKPLVRDEFVYQAFPTVRFHIPGDQAIHYWHYDSDEDHRHPEGEINFQVALTNIHDTQAMWIESVPGLGDYSPMNMSYGEYYVFNGNKCTHGNKCNETNKTRVSFDFRILPLKKYENYLKSNTNKSSATMDRKFIVGSYYSKF